MSFYDAMLTVMEDPKVGCNPRLAKRLMRKAERAKHHASWVQPIYVAHFSVDRAYGGPEEGGWWYDRRVLEEMYRVFSWQEARSVLRELREENEQPRFNRFSCANRGENEHEFALSHSAEDLTERQCGLTRPRYE